MTRSLNARQERFIAEYLKDQNANAAAIRAGYSANTKGTHAAELMRNPLVRERITLELSDMYAAMGVTALNLLRQQAAMAFFDPCKLFDAQGKPIPLHELDEATRSVLTISYDVRPDGFTILRVRMPNRQQALAALEKRYAQFMEMQMELLQSYAGDDEVQEEDAGLAPTAPPAPATFPKLDLERQAEARARQQPYQVHAQPYREIAPRDPGAGENPGEVRKGGLAGLVAPLLGR